MNKQYYVFEVKSTVIDYSQNRTIIRSSCKEIPCSYEFALQKAKKQKELINIIDRLRK